MIKKQAKQSKRGPAKGPKKRKIPAKVLKYLEKAGVKHEILEHRTVYSAIDAAATMKKKLNEIVKSLLVKADKDYYVILVPGDHNLDFNKLKKEISKNSEKPIKTIKIPSEKIIENALKIKAEAITAFGELHKIGVVMDRKLAKTKKAVFASGSYGHSIEMAVKDFIKMESALLGSFGVKRKAVKVKPKKKGVAKTKKK